MSDETTDQQSNEGSHSHVSPFDAIRHEDSDGNEYWSACQLAETLEYAKWSNFQKVILQARIACEASGYAVSDHFADIGNMITIGKGGRRKVADVRLSRYACYLVIQNADPEKPIVALGQTYFAVQTRRQELSDAQLLANMSEDQRRLFTRQQITERNKLLAATAEGAGVVTSATSPSFRITAIWACTMARRPVTSLCARDSNQARPSSTTWAAKSLQPTSFG